jgi:hypothetical protein
MSKVARIAGPLICLAALAACKDRTLDRDRPVQTEPGRTEPGKTTVTGANVGSVNNESAIGRIVAARCEREMRCTNVGADKKYATPDACSQKIRTEMHDDLNAKDCPYGVDQKELEECLTDIRKEECNNPIDTISRVAACRTGDMCLKTGAPNR